MECIRLGLADTVLWTPFCSLLLRFLSLFLPRAVAFRSVAEMGVGPGVPLPLPPRRLADSLSSPTLASTFFSISSFISIESPLCICFSISWAFSPSFFQYSINRCPGSSDDSRVSGSVSRLFDSSIPASSLHCTSCSALTTAPATHRSIPATPRSRAGRSGVTLFFEPHVMRDLV